MGKKRGNKTIKKKKTRNRTNNQNLPNRMGSNRIYSVRIVHTVARIQRQAGFFLSQEVFGGISRAVSGKLIF